MFGATIWEEGWPRDIEPFVELGERLLGAIAEEAGGLKHWTSLSVCAHDMLEGKRENIGMCLAFQQAIDGLPQGATHMAMPARKIRPGTRPEEAGGEAHPAGGRVCQDQPPPPGPRTHRCRAAFRARSTPPASWRQMR